MKPQASLAEYFRALAKSGGIILGIIAIFTALNALITEYDSRRRDISMAANAVGQSRPNYFPNNQNTEPASTPIPTPTPKPRVKIINERYGVEPLGYRWIKFSVSVPSRLTGGFVVYGPAEQVGILVLDDENFDHWRRNESYRQYVDLGYVSRGKINRALPAGDYNLVLNNSRHLFSRAEVAIEIFLQEL